MPWARPEDSALTTGLGNRDPHTGYGRYCQANLPGLRRLRAGGDPVTSNLVQLHALAVELTGRGFRASVLHEDGALKLQVGNRAAPGGCEDITVAADDNGAWCFWWSWGDRIALVTDIAAAAFKIAYVLTPQAG